MSMTKTRAAAAATVALMAALWLGAAPAQATSGGLDEDGQYILDATSEHRLSTGHAPLTEDAALDIVAQNWAEAMAGGEGFKHNPNLKSQMPAGWTYFGENVAWNNYNLYPGYDSISKLMSQWIASPGHEANMVNDEFTHVGIGVYTDDSGTWGVQVFAQYHYHDNYPEITLGGGGEFVQGQQVTVELNADYPIDANVEWWTRVGGGSWKKSSGKVAIVDGEGAKGVMVDGIREFKVKHLGKFSNVVAVTPDLPDTVLVGGGDYFPGTAQQITFTVDPAYTGKGQLWVKKNGHGWSKSKATVSFTDGVGAKTVKPSAATTRYKVKIGGAFSNDVTYTRVYPTLGLSFDAGDDGGHLYHEAFAVNVVVDPGYTGTVTLRVRKPGGTWKSVPGGIAVVDGTGSRTVSQANGKRDYIVVFADRKSNVIRSTRVYTE